MPFSAPPVTSAKALTDEVAKGSSVREDCESLRLRSGDPSALSRTSPLSGVLLWSTTGKETRSPGIRKRGIDGSTKNSLVTTMFRCPETKPAPFV